MSELEKKNQSLEATMNGPLGFEDESEDDMVVPRVKVINLLSPECKAKEAEEGDIINSLTKEKLNSSNFVPVFKFSSNIWWKPRNEGGGIQCQARNGKDGQMSSGEQLKCVICRKNEFDNTKTGRESFPVCTKYINFFGFFEGQRMPIVLSFSKTNFNEGKKLFSLAKVTLQNMWNHSYSLNSKEMAKNGNTWFNIVVAAAGATSEEDRAFGMQLYKTFKNAEIRIDEEDTATEAAPKVDLEGSEF